MRTQTTRMLDTKWATPKPRTVILKRVGPRQPICAFCSLRLSAAR